MTFLGHPVWETRLKPEPQCLFKVSTHSRRGVKAWHAKQRYISTLPELNEWTLDGESDIQPEPAIISFLSFS